MSEPMMYLDHVICLSCGAVRDKALHIPSPRHGMDAGDYPYPVMITAECARELARYALCHSCDTLSRFQLALRPLEAR